MARRLKVYGWTGRAIGVPGRHPRYAAPSLAEARRFCELTLSVGWPGRDWICETGNDEEQALATENGTIYAKPSSPADGREWVKLL